ncbi:MAG: hypothetical protein KDC92_03805 [Bacteroidetes bacterium]|nr:hypothetical protein [Bacteroidota bacterium]
MRKKITTYLAVAFALLAVQNTQAQTVVLEEEVNAEKPLETEPKGKNSKFDFYPYFGIGLNVGEQSEAFPHKFQSRYFQYGTKYKFKLNKAQSAIFDIRYQLTRSIVDHEEMGSHETVKRVFFTSHDVAGAIYHRFNFDWNRGNVMGTYLDIGAYFSYNFALTYNEVAEAGELQSNTEYTKLKYDTPVQYGVEARLGRDKWSLFGQMRLTERGLNKYLYLPAFEGYDQPNMLVGIELGLF